MIDAKAYEELMNSIKKLCSNKMNKDNFILLYETNISKDKFQQMKDEMMKESVYILDVNYYEDVKSLDDVKSLEDVKSSKDANFSTKEKKLDVMMKVLIRMFAELTIHDELSSSNERNLDDKKTMITCFEKAIKSIRYKIMSATELLKAFDDNLELLVEVSEVFDATGCFKECVDHFLKTFHMDYLVVIFNKEEE